MLCKHNPFLNSEYEETNLERLETDQALFRINESVKKLKTETNDNINREVAALTDSISALSEQTQQQLETSVSEITAQIDTESASVNNKIDTAVTALNSYVNAAENRVNARVDNIVANNSATEGNSELIDIRTGDDGSIYATAGKAVRTQISALRKDEYIADLIYHNQSYQPTLSFINSSVSSTGNVLNNAALNRACTEDLLYIPCGCIAIIKTTENYLFSYYRFDENSIFQNATHNKTSKVLDSGFYRFLVTKPDNADLTPEEAAGAISVQIIDYEKPVFDLHNNKLLLDHTTNTVQGKFIAINGNEDSSLPFSHTGIIPLHNISHLYIRGHFYCKPSVMSNIAFYSRPILSSQFFISAWNPSDTEQTAGIYLGLTEVPIPQNAEYMSICSHNNYTDFDIYAVPEHKTFQTIASVMEKVVLCDTTKPRLKIKLIGDSITHGMGGTGYTNDAEHGELICTDGDRSWYVNSGGVCWANMLKSYLEEKFHCTVKNYGTSGRASGHLRLYLDQLIDDDDSIIICMIGTNDRNNESDPYSSHQRNPSQTLENLQAICDYCTALGKDIIFMSSIPASVQNENNNKVCHMEDIDNVMMKLAAQNHMEYISVYKEFLQYCKYADISIDSLLSDGLHPNDSGYEVMFEIITKALGFGIKRSNADW